MPMFKAYTNLYMKGCKPLYFRTASCSVFVIEISVAFVNLCGQRRKKKMALAGQLETEMEIKAAAHAFHDVFSRRPHHVSNMAPGHIQSAELHEGDWGQKGSVVYWNYTHDGVPEVAKEIVEEIDDEKNLRTFKVIEGHLLEKYPDFHVTVQATPKGDGSLVRWTIRYVKKNEDTAEPHGIIQLVTNMTKDIDAHLTQNA